jgi:hypothetical protein
MYFKNVLEPVDPRFYLQYGSKSDVEGLIVLQRRPACHAACNLGAIGLIGACCAATGGAGCVVCTIGFELLRADCHEKCEG